MFNVHLDTVPSSDAWTADPLTLRVRVDPAAGPEARAAALAAMHAQVRRVLDGKRMHRVAVAVEEAAALPPDPRTGKLKLVVDARAPR